MASWWCAMVLALLLGACVAGPTPHPFQEGDDYAATGAGPAVPPNPADPGEQDQDGVDAYPGLANGDDGSKDLDAGFTADTCFDTAMDTATDGCEDVGPPPDTAMDTGCDTD